MAVTPAQDPAYTSGAASFFFLARYFRNILSLIMAFNPSCDDNKPRNEMRSDPARLTKGSAHRSEGKSEKKFQKFCFDR